MNNASINILLAEDNDVTRNMLAGILQTQGYNIIHATDGGSAIQKIQEQEIHMAFVDINMEPTGGLEFVKYIVVHGFQIPVAIITGEDGSDILTEASALGVLQVMQKPIDPARLLKVATRMLKKQGISPTAMGSETHKSTFSHEELMQKAIEIAEKNALGGRGGPYGAVIASADGQILGEGVNGIQSRVDPIAHAEVMAIRQASERLGELTFNDCYLYCSSEPTKVGRALIESVGVKKVFYGLSADEVAQVRGRAPSSDPEYEQICKDEAMEMLKSTKPPPQS